MNFFSNPFFKTLISAVLGSILPAIDAAISHPTGGLAGALSGNPVYGLLWTGGALFVHDFLSHYQYAAATAQAPAAPHLAKGEATGIAGPYSRP